MAHVPPFVGFLDTNGDGTGVKNAIGNYSASPVDFKYIRPKGSEGDLFISSLVIHLQSPVKINGQGYGASMFPLINGITLFNKNEEAIMLRNLTSDIPVKTNSDWNRYGGKTNVDPYTGGDYFFKATFRAVPPTEPLFLPPEHSIGVTLNDDFTGLISHTFCIEGRFA